MKILKSTGYGIPLNSAVQRWHTYIPIKPWFRSFQIWRLLRLIGSQEKKLRIATYMAAVCKFRGEFFLVWFRLWHSSAQPFINCLVFLLQLILGVLCRVYPHQLPPRQCIIPTFDQSEEGHLDIMTTYALLTGNLVWLYCSSQEAKKRILPRKYSASANRKLKKKCKKIWQSNSLNSSSGMYDSEI